MKRYAIILENAGENWAAYVPDLPGCVATGETVEEVQRLKVDPVCKTKKRSPSTPFFPA